MSPDDITAWHAPWPLYRVTVCYTDTAGEWVWLRTPGGAGYTLIDMARRHVEHGLTLGEAYARMTVAARIAEEEGVDLGAAVRERPQDIGGGGCEK